MTRYALARTSEYYNLAYVAASYAEQGDGVVYTPMRTDACTYVSMDRAVEVWKHLTSTQHGEFVLIAIEDNLV